MNVSLCIVCSCVLEINGKYDERKKKKGHILHMPESFLINCLFKLWFLHAAGEMKLYFMIQICETWHGFNLFIFSGIKQHSGEKFALYFIAVLMSASPVGFCLGQGSSAVWVIFFCPEGPNRSQHYVPLQPSTWKFKRLELLMPAQTLTVLNILLMRGS